MTRHPRPSLPARLRALLPRGGTLPAAVSARRHRILVWVLWCQVAALAAFGLARGFGAGEVALVLAPVAAIAVAAGMRGRRRPRLRAVLVAVGLLSTSAALVHFWHGTTEAHFHFFLMIALVSLYQDWIPHLVAFAYVVVHHGVLGMLAAEHVFGDAAGDMASWKWALIHAGFVAAASVAAMAAWRYQEDARTEADDRARDQAALRRVAEAVSSGERGRGLFDRIAAEAAGIAGTPAAVVVRTATDPAGPASVVGVHGAGAPPPGALAAVGARGALRFDGADADAAAVAAVRVAGASWGAIAALCPPGRAPEGRGAWRLRDFADLVGASIEGAAAREELERLAHSDSLTGLASHRAFHERLAREVVAAGRHGRPLAVALLDLDHFKRINDEFGHDVGDTVLVGFARLLAQAARAGDLAGRIGGEEFALLLPDTDAEGALILCRRLLDAVRARAFGSAGPVTASAGICDLTRAGDAGELMRLADGALYWAKAHGRDEAVAYSPEVVEALSAEDRAERTARQRNLASLRALAHAVDARDHHTRRHSERVADVAVRLAAELGWSPGDCSRLRDAGVLHDVGKIGVPDAVLLKPGALTAEEHAQVRQHAAIGAAIAAEVLDPEQVLWVRHHHERVDGRGYPDGLDGDELSEGAMIMAVADAWDAMIGAREYRDARDADDALAECRREAGAQFAPRVVEALERLAAAGALDGRAPLDAVLGRRGG